MKPFKFLTNKKLRTTTYWQGDIQYTVLIPEDITDDYEIGYYLRGWRDAHYNSQPHSIDVFSDRRNYVLYELGYSNYHLTQQH